MPDGARVELANTRLSDTVAHIKRRLHEEHKHAEPYRQILVHRGSLRDEMTLGAFAFPRCALQADSVFFAADARFLLGDVVFEAVPGGSVAAVCRLLPCCAHARCCVQAPDAPPAPLPGRWACLWRPSPAQCDSRFAVPEGAETIGLQTTSSYALRAVLRANRLGLEKLRDT